MTTWTPALVETWAIETAFIERMLPAIRRNGLQRPILNAMRFKDWEETRFELNAQSELRADELAKQNTYRKERGIEPVKDDGLRHEFAWGENPKGYIPASAIQNYEEFIYLLVVYLRKHSGIKYREMAACLWAWADAKAGGQTSFRKWCRRTGRKYSTAMDAVISGIKHLCREFSNSGIAVKKYLTSSDQIGHKWGANQIGLRIASSPQSVILERSVKSDYSDPQVVIALEKSIRRANRRARRMKRRR